MKKSLIILLLILISFSCSEKSDKELYVEKSAELFDYLLSKEKSCSCIVEPNQNLEEIIKEEKPEYDIRGKLMTELNLTKESELEYLLDLSENFKLNQSVIDSEIKLIPQNRFDSILQKNYLVTRDTVIDNRRQVLDSLCPKGILFVKKPVFNKKFTTAITSLSYGFMHMSIGPWTYHYVDGNWEEKQ